jgi:hypothetical protein
MLNDSNVAALFAQVAPTVPVTVNPVFGEWDPAKVQLTGETGSLSKTLS